MNYVMADIHGEYDKYIEMLELINFQDEDTLYVLGDVVDRGEQPIEVLMDMAERPNVYPIIGNHDQMAIDALSKLMADISNGRTDKLSPDTMKAFAEWRENGGAKTIEGFIKLSEEERQDMLDYLCDFSLFEAVDIDDKTFILVHSGLGDFDNKGKHLKNYTVLDLAFTRVDYERKYFDDDNIFIVSGHIPTFKLCGEDKIYKTHNNICIDCGAVYGKSLACLCLETMEEYYV